MPGIKIIFEDKDILVVYKPAGLATQSGAVGRRDLVSELKKMLAKQAAVEAKKEAAAKGASAKGTSEKGASAKGAAAAKKGAQEPYLALIHRLDQPVEGLLVFGKNKKAAASLTAALGDDTLKKSYLAVLWGDCEQESGELVDLLYKDADNCAQIVQDPAENPEAKVARLSYEVMARKCVNLQGTGMMPGTGRMMPAVAQESDENVSCEGRMGEVSAEVQESDENVPCEGRMAEAPADEACITLVRVTLDTGRFHQIRAQMAHMGHPLLGDNKYGTEESLAASSKLGVSNPALCANTITVKHPTNGRQLNFEIIPENPAFRLFIG